MTNLLPKMWCPECKDGKFRNEKYCETCGNKLEEIKEVNGVQLKWEG